MRPLILVLSLAAPLLATCSSNDTTGNPGTLSYSANGGWNCANGINCQDVYDFSFTAGSVLTIRVSNVSAGSVAQLALYGPGTALGGTNLLTGTPKELRCLTGNGCNDFTAGEQVTGFTATQSGTYRLAVTRDGGNSCGGTGTYRLDVTSSKNFTALGQTAEDTPSAANGVSCSAP